ncbi:MAG: HD-GYP domain-containing protein [Actinomycetota bacterium]|nr:HD domain-containing protein [Actinomycetota bacterium]
MAGSDRLRVVGPEDLPAPETEPEEWRLRDQLLNFAKDLNEVYRRERTRARELEAALEELQDSYLATVRTLAAVVEAKDSRTRAHLDRAHLYAVALARRIAPEMADDPGLRYGSLLHDIGKIGVPEGILGKQGPLTREEWEIVKTHPLIGGQICAPVKFLQKAIPLIEGHHERWDGAGYPRGLKGEDIPLQARVFAIVDAFDAMTADRPYRTPMTFEMAVNEIVRASGTQFDPAVVQAFSEMCAGISSDSPFVTELRRLKH